MALSAFTVVRSMLKLGIKGLVYNLAKLLKGDEKKILFFKTDSRERQKIFSGLISRTKMPKSFLISSIFYQNHG